MTSIDYAAIGIMLLSLLLGLWRGLTYELLSLLGWPLAFLMSWQLAGKVEALLPVGEANARMALAYILVFIATLLLWAMLVWLFTQLIKAAGLGGMDSLLGGLFGLLRGVIVIVVLVLLAGMTNIPKQAFWRHAKFSRTAEQAALLAKPLLPDNVARRIHYYR